MVIERHKARVANRSSNPKCRVPTTGPTDEPDKVSSIGIAAHISAASPGGQRYDKSISSNERKSINNGIWLCSNCSIEIDRDPKCYSVNLLKEWKRKAESLAKQELGQKLPDKNHTINTLTAALTGHTKLFIADAIENVCKASSQSLETLDPRFHVQASHIDNKTVFSIHAKENVEAKLIVDKEFINKFTHKYRELIDHGEDLEIEGKSISFKGSRLLEKISSETCNGKFVISHNKLKKTCIQKIWLVNPANQLVNKLDDFKGDITFGKKSFSFKGSTFNELLWIHYRIYLHKNDEKSFHFTINVNFKRWYGCPIKTLPYFDKIHEFIKQLIEGWEINTALEVNGNEILKGIGSIPGNNDEIKRQYYLIRYLLMARRILDYLNLTVNFDATNIFTHDAFKGLAKAYRIISEGNRFTINQFSGNANCTLVADDDLRDIKNIEDSKAPSSLSFKQEYPDKIMIFSNEIILPRLSCTFTKMSPNIRANVSKIKPGDNVLIEWIPEEDCVYIEEFITP